MTSQSNGHALRLDTLSREFPRWSFLTFMNSTPPIPEIRTRCLPRTAYALLAVLAGQSVALPGVAAMAESRSAAAARAGSIEGRVKNAVTGTYLNNARITIAGTNLLALTDPSGRFRITGVPAGERDEAGAYPGSPMGAGAQCAELQHCFGRWCSDFCCAKRGHRSSRFVEPVPPIHHRQRLVLAL